MAKIYVASSWRNSAQPGAVQALRNAGHEVYDSRAEGFHWSDIDQAWQYWEKEELRTALVHPIAEHGFQLDWKAMNWADVFVGILPFGSSASIEMGWAAGQRKQTILLLWDGEPELMVKVFDHICCTLDEVIELLTTETQKA